VTIAFPDDRVYKFQARQQCNNFGPISAPTITFAQVPTEGNTAGAALVPAGGGSALTDGSIPGPLNLIDFGANIYNPTVFTLTTAEGYAYVIDQKLGITSLTDPNGNSLTINAGGVTSSTASAHVKLTPLRS